MQPAETNAPPFFDFAEIPLFAPDAADQAVSRAYVAAGRCPMCGDGPFAVVAGHTVRKHGVDRHELRDMLGVYKSTSICDAGHSASVRARGRQRFRDGKFDPRQGGGARRSPRQLSAAAQRENARKLNENRDKALRALDRMREPQRAARKRQVTEAWTAGLSLGQIAESLGLSANAVRYWLKLAGIHDPHEILRRRSRNPDEYRPRLQKGRDTHAERMAAMRAARVKRFAELGGDYAATEKLASEIGLSGGAVREALRKAGAHVPDGRSNTTKRYRPQPVPVELRARCTVAGCGRIHSARGLCGMHYQRARKQQGEVVTS